MEDKQYFLKRLDALNQVRQNWLDDCKLIAKVTLPRGVSKDLGFTVEDESSSIFRDVYDNEGIIANRTLAAGLMGGMTNPSRQWLRLATPDPKLMEFEPVKIWLNEVTRILMWLFARSNTYEILHRMYYFIGPFGTSAAIVTDSYDKGLHLTNLKVNDFSIAADFEGKVNTLYRELQLPVITIVREFGLNNCSRKVVEHYDKGNYEEKIDLIHIIEPREDRDRTKRDNLNMPYKSVYMEKNSDENKVLRESGFQDFKALVPRWSRLRASPYGDGPGIEALGDLKQLQHNQFNKALITEYHAKPPLAIPDSLRGKPNSRLPGGIFYYPANTNPESIKPLMQAPMNPNLLLEDITDIRNRVSRAFYKDLFMLIATAQNTMTATEVAERQEEKLLMLGPVIERLHNELLDPLIDIAFTRAMEMTDSNGEPVIPPPPPELEGSELKVEFISMLAQAQKAVGSNASDRFVASLGMVAQLKPEVLDKFDQDEWADAYADTLGVDPNQIRTGESVALIRQQRAEQQAQQEQMLQAQQMAEVAAKASQAKDIIPTE